MTTNRYPWRSARLGWVVAALALLVGGPLFLRMPLWCDVTLYDTAARSLLNGGVLYRDVFDTNPPGFPLLLAGVRGMCGFGWEVLRLVDLLVVGVITLLLVRWVKSAGGSVASAAWLVAGVAAFYLFLSESCHVQRDVWMLLPALIAARKGWMTEACV